MEILSSESGWFNSRPYPQITYKNLTMPPIEEKVINGILCWGYYRGEGETITMHEYTKEQLTARLLEAEKTIQWLQNAQTE